MHAEALLLVEAKPISMKTLSIRDFGIFLDLHGVLQADHEHEARAATESASFFSTGVAATAESLKEVSGQIPLQNNYDLPNHIESQRSGVFPCSITIRKSLLRPSRF